ncbi:MAG: hypothetical protein H6707_00150 [Deltaproteobacteria bacterium]|nr:hypothetical protein [Deltaproteobacteria bacterium]
MNRLASLFVCVACLGSAPASAQQSSYRLSGAVPARGGATLTFVYRNTWPTAQKSAANQEVELFGYLGNPSSRTDLTRRFASGSTWTYAKEGAIPLGSYSWSGDGQMALFLDYQRCGVKAGDAFFTSAIWLASGHQWGATQTGRMTGCDLILPAPLK